MDIIDQANEYAEVHLRAALSQRKAEDIPQARGSCLNCDATLPQQQRWCDAGCRDDFFGRWKRGNVGTK
jgi:hypothetical protein